MNQIKTLFVVSLLLTCMYIPCIAAAGNNEGPHAYDAKVNKTIGQQVNKTIGQVQAANVRAGSMGMAADAQTIRKDVKNDLQRAREIYRNDRTPENQQMLTDAAKNHLLQMLDLMIERLTLLQEQIEFAEENNNMVPDGASENIDRYLLRLEGYKPEVESADTPADIRSVARSINQEWRSIRREILHYTKYMVAVRIEAYIDKANDISDRLGVKISELEDEGVNTTDLRQNLDAFDEKLACVEKNHGLAKDAVSDEEINSGEVQQYIRNASRCIREANHHLREMFRELRAFEGYRNGAVMLDGTGTLEAGGSADEAEDEAAADETVNESADDPANESDSGTDEVGDADTDTPGNETESGTDDGGVAS